MNKNHDPKNGEFSSGAGGLAAGLGAEHEKRNGVTALPPAPAGKINLYHGTTPENADSIVASQKFHSYQSTWTNTSPDRASSYRAVVAVTVSRRLIGSQIKDAGKRDDYDVVLPRGARLGKIVRVK